MTALLAPDPAVPQRDALLDERRMGALLGSALTGAAADGCERVNAKYRVGESLRVAYRIVAAGRSHTLAGRTFTGRSARVYRRAVAASRVDGPLPGVLHAPELETVFWTFPNDRRLAGLRLLDGRSAELDRLVGRPVARTRLVAYAPERAATAECLDGGDRVLAYVKLHWDAAERELASAEAASAAVGPADPRLRLPRVLAASLPDGVLVLEPLAGRRLDGLTTAELEPALHALGAGLATLHGVCPLPARRFDRLDHDRLTQAAELIGRVRPDCRRVAASVLDRLLDRAADGAGDPVHVHGDANLRNALLDATASRRQPRRSRPRHGGRRAAGLPEQPARQRARHVLATRSGALDFMSTSGVNQTVVPVGGINAVAFAFDDYGKVWAAMDGELGGHVRAQFEKARPARLRKACSTTATATSPRARSRSRARTT